MTAKASPKILFLVSGIWLSLALLWMWLLGARFRIEHQAWGAMTVGTPLPVIGWLIPLIWAFIRFAPALQKQSEQLC